MALFSVCFLGCNKKTDEKQKNSFNVIQPSQTSNLYSYIGSEYEVTFKAVAKTSDYTLAELAVAGYERRSVESLIQNNVKYLFGPVTNRELGGMKLNFTVQADWNNLSQDGDQVVVPYTYNGTWILANSVVTKAKTLAIPVPFDTRKLFTQNWLSCTDSNPEHATTSFYWYFWDPKRSGCDHTLDIEYQIVMVSLGAQTVNQTSTYPEYQKIIQSNGVKNNLQMTFAFGYVNDPSDANPDTDNDYGMGQYRIFIQFMDKQAAALKLVKAPITQAEYLDASYPDKLIGYRYAGVKDGVKVEIKVVAAADIDQMELFAKSYAHDHDGYFGWFGHSRVGSGFDAMNFASIVSNNPSFYSLSPDYQLVYWAGCNSYSYYTLPFFEQKANLNKVLDPRGTKSLDIIANALPSLFSFNATNAAITYKALINWKKPTSYQDIVSGIEKYAQRNGATVIVNVLGDEDNAKP